jgi:hypothetical protein
MPRFIPAEIIVQILYSVKSGIGCIAGPDEIEMLIEIISYDCVPYRTQATIWLYLASDPHGPT